MKEEIRPCVVLMRLERRLICALHVLAFQIIQLGLLVGIALDGLDAAQALDHLAVQRSRLCHALFVDLFIRLFVHQHQKDADQRHEQRDGEQHGVHAEQNDAGDDSMEISITRLSAMLVKIDLMVFASE